MKWRTHKRISHRVLDDLNNPFFDQFRKYLIDGSIFPDQQDRDSPHHYGRENTIEHYINLARRSYLVDDLPNAFFYLGNAFHYIQDNWTYLDGRDPGHDEWENRISDSKISSDLFSLINYLRPLSKDIEKEYYGIISLFSQNINDPNETFSIATLMHPDRSVPSIDFNFSYQICYKVAKSVLGNKNSIELQKNIENLYKKYYINLHEVERITSVNILTKNKNMIFFKSKEGFFSIFYHFISFFYKISLRYDLMNYNKRKHLIKEIEQYNNEVNEKCINYKEWYLIKIPILNYNHVKIQIPKYENALDNDRVN